MASKQEKLIRKKFKGKATFRIASGSDNPFNTAVSRVIVSPKDNDAYKKLKSMESTLERAFDVEVVVFR